MVVNESKCPVVIFSLIIILILLAGCKGVTAVPASPSPPTTLSASIPSPVASPLPSPAGAAELVNKVSQSLSAVKSYSLERNINTVKYSKSDRSDEVDTAIMSRATLDLSNRKMQMDDGVSIKQGGRSLPIVESSIYVVDNTIYIRGLFPSDPQLWSKTAATGDYWQAQNQAGLIVDLFKGQNPELLSPETIHSGNQDVSCDVIQIIPDLAKFWSLMAGQPAMQLPSSAPAGVAYKQFMKNTKMKLWVSRSSGLPAQAQMSMDVQIGPSEVPSLSSEVTMNANLMMQFHDYGQAVFITLPDAAAGAADLNLQKAQ